MKAVTRKSIYSVLAVLTVVTGVCAQQNVFSGQVAYFVAVASGVLSAFMHAWTTPDDPVMPAVLKALELVKK